MSSKTVQPIRRREQGETKSRRSARQKREKREIAQSSVPTTYFDYNLMLVIIFLTCFGLIMLYSASAYSAQADFQDDMSYFIKQAMISAGSFGVMLIVSRIDYHVYGAFSFEIYVFAMIMMALVQTPLGTTINGARRWIQLPGNMTLQPSEITKIAIILFISCEICKMGRKVNDWLGIRRLLIYGGVAAGGVFILTDNLSTAVIVMAITCVLIFVAHPKTKPFLMIAAIGAGILIVIVAILAVYATNSDNSESEESQHGWIRKALGWHRLPGASGTVCDRIRGILRKRSWKQHAEAWYDPRSAE